MTTEGHSSNYREKVKQHLHNLKETDNLIQIVAEKLLSSPENEREKLKKQLEILKSRKTGLSEKYGAPPEVN